MDGDGPVLNKYSRILTLPKIRGPSQAMLFATGLQPADMLKAQVGIGAVWFEGNPCNMHLLDLSGEIKQGVEEAGLLGMRFSCVGVSDGISQGTSGMRYSLASREVIADSMETMMGAHYYDALVGVPGCDKNMPGTLMAMLRLDRPSLVVYGGTILRGHCPSLGPVDIGRAFELYGETLAGKITEEQRVEGIGKACPGAGACGGMYTANTMSSAIEAMGMSLPYSSSNPAVSAEKRRECRNVGSAVRNLLERNILPSQIVTKKSMENAITLGIALGGSTNLVLHMLAISRTAGIPLELDDFQNISDRVPYLANLMPSGDFVMADLHKVGGTPAVLKFLLKQGFIHGDCLTVTGQTLTENLSTVPDLTDDQKIIRPISNPIKSTGHISILYGNVATLGAVAKLTGKEGLSFTGPAICYDGEEDMAAGFKRGEIKKGMVVVIRYSGPKGAPGMPEMLTPTGLIFGAGLSKDVALITDGRFSGASHGFIVGHVCPEAQEGGNVALLQNGDEITIDAPTRTISAKVSDEELSRRRAAWRKPALKATKGALYKYAMLVRPASEGCVTDM
ncbi:dihydroxy-acid and 6-phosphogluconate dehydratase [Gonapodya prolifera JEL478]|uniref:dihydroxy-acid dehydratase n=1 Tax=Gonapodya prolifera (strain JEL478) TaxID=1344416 RepID=A0A139A601_GONPJ|nr:dihydroxy-acid and 6-phosphogluconate dehydratase [Gonapodya prolifera JEL478]|eukprot:KXS12226.1 dihydroxy-acid and 6-phosphogluconate dehydratase [Gonapodya prolifera JEL478]